MLAQSLWKQALKAEAHRLGFSFFGVSKAVQLDQEAQQLEQWLNQNRHGKMAYMENHFDMRTDPRKLVPGAKTVISLLFNYYTHVKQADGAPKISTYAHGEDYHFVVKRKIKDLMAFANENIGTINGRVFVDSAPVMDKAWAKKSGLGWVGKNTNIINKNQGSFFFIAELISDLDLAPDGPVKDYCGTCTACLDACPTDALTAPYQIDGSKCISYFTIELKDEMIPEEMAGKFENWMFGCDICQDVCPWNRFSKQHNEPAFTPKEELLNMTANEWTELTEEIFQNMFKKSPINRTKFTGLKRNIGFLKPNK